MKGTVSRQARAASVERQLFRANSLERRIGALVTRPPGQPPGESGSMGEPGRFPIVLDTFCLITNGRHVTGS